MQAYVQCCGICARFYKLLFYAADTAHTIFTVPANCRLQKLRPLVLQCWHSLIQHWSHLPQPKESCLTIWLGILLHSWVLIIQWPFWSCNMLDKSAICYFLSHFINARDRVHISGTTHCTDATMITWSVICDCDIVSINGKRKDTC